MNRFRLGVESFGEMCSRALTEEIDREVLTVLCKQLGRELPPRRNEKMPRKVEAKMKILEPLGFTLVEEVQDEELTSTYYAKAPDDMPFEDFALYKLKYS